TCAPPRPRCSPPIARSSCFRRSAAWSGRSCNLRCLKSRLPGANLLWDNATKRDLANAVTPTSPVVARVIFSSAVAKAGRNSIDGELDGPQNLLIGVGPAIFPHQLNLNVVQRVEIGNSITDGTLQKRIAL